jgi:hypothetical protein
VDRVAKGEQMISNERNEESRTFGESNEAEKKSGENQLTKVI